LLAGLNHITLTVENLGESIAFYSLLGFEPHVRWDRGAYLSLNELWLCLSLGRVSRNDDYSHIAFSIESSRFAKIRSALTGKNIELWKENSSEGKSIYFLDPSGHKLEAHVGTLQSRLRELKENPYDGLVWLKKEG